MYAHRHEHASTGIFAFLAGAAAMAAAGAYYLYGPDGKEHKRTLDKGVDRLKKEILTRMSELSDITQEKYEDVVDETMKKYGLVKRIGKEKAGRLSLSLKKRWEEMKDAAERAKRDAESELWDEELGDISY